MISLSPLLILVFAELLLLFGAAAIALIAMIVIRKRKERNAVNRLISRIKEDEQRRREETRGLMQGKFGFEGEQLDALVNQIAREEKRLYQNLVNLFLNRDLNKLEVLHVECEGVTEPYRTLDIPEPTVAESATGSDNGVSDLAVELEMLREENERLTTELGVTMDTMGKMLNEYASMYGGGSDGELDKEKMIESFRSSDDEHGEDSATVADEQQEVMAAEIDEPAEAAVSEALVVEEHGGSEEEFDIDIDTDIDIGIDIDDETVVIEPEGLSGNPDDETLVVEVGDDEFEELEEIDDETELIDLAAGDPENPEKLG